MTERIETVQPEGWPRPRGYANGKLASGRALYVAGQIGWDESESMVGEDLVSQFRRALANVLTVVEAAGGGAEDIVKMTIYVTDVSAYRSSILEIGAAYREVLGKRFPAMTLLGVSGLMHPLSLVEIDATAMLAAEPSP